MSMRPALVRKENALVCKVIQVPNTSDFRVLDTDGQYLMYVHFVDAGRQQLDYVNYFDNQSVKVRREFYDNRGFLSRTSFLVKHQEVHTEVYYDLQGQVKIIKQYDITGPEPKLRLITLKNYQQRMNWALLMTSISVIVTDKRRRP